MIPPISVRKLTALVVGGHPAVRVNGSMLVDELLPARVMLHPQARFEVLLLEHADRSSFHVTLSCRLDSGKDRF